LERSDLPGDVLSSAESSGSMGGRLGGVFSLKTDPLSVNAKVASSAVCSRRPEEEYCAGSKATH
jgi:hypothetical protein